MGAKPTPPASAPLQLAKGKEMRLRSDERNAEKGADWQRGQKQNLIHQINYSTNVCVSYHPKRVAKGSACCFHAGVWKLATNNIYSSMVMDTTEGGFRGIDYKTR
jgi:hypothetical protein